MTIRFRKFRDIAEIELFLGGAVFGKNIGDGVPGLVGKTLIFTQPTGATCTFTAGADYYQRDTTMLSRVEIKTQLEAAIADLTVRFLEQRIVLIETVPTLGKGVNISGGTGRDELGLSETNAATGKVYDIPTGAAPKMLQAYPVDSGHVLITVE